MFDADVRISDDAHRGAGKVGLVFDYYITSLFDVLEKIRFSGRDAGYPLALPLQPCDQIRIAKETAEALAHLEDKGIVHRDLAARNIMLDHEMSVKVGDFGMAK